MTAVLRARDVEQLGDVVTRLRRALRRRMRQASPGSDLPMAQLEVLQSIAEREPVRVGEIAESLDLAINTVSTLVAALADGGMVTRTRGAQDKRAVLLTTTGPGRDYLKRWQHDLEGLLAGAMAGLDAAGRRSLLAAMPALRQVVDRLAGDPER